MKEKHRDGSNADNRSIIRSAEEEEVAMNQTNTSRIFISYSHRGNGPKWKDALMHALHVFGQHHLLDVWQDGNIRVSSYWDDDIKQAISRSNLAVVLLTPEMLDPRTPADPNYILNTEFPALRNRQQCENLPVFPVICEVCDWKAHDWLRATQAPNNSNPLSQLLQTDQDRVFRKLATDIAEELSRVALAELSASSLPGGDRAGVRGEPETLTYLEKFPLTRSPGSRQEKLIGREQELALLDLSFSQPHSAIVFLVAWGGVGKTMLVQHWLQRLQYQGWFNARRVYAWSFYSQGTREDRQASEDHFLAHAIEWFGVQCEPTFSAWDKGRLLADVIARERTLLILDGIEPLQYPPGPMGGQLRAPGIQSLLKQLARKANANYSTFDGLCIVTTREPLTDLSDFQRAESFPWGSVLRVDLGNLTDEAGAALLHQAGANRAGAAEIKANDKELLAASSDVDGHALTLNLLGRFLARAHGADIRRRDLVKIEDADRKEQGGTTFKMLAAFENWFANSGEFGARQLAVLRILGLFDRPADAGCIVALRKPPIIPGLTDSLFTMRFDTSTGQASVQPLLDEDWNTATSFLADFGLIMVLTDVDNNEPLLDSHPLIREYFACWLLENFAETSRTAHQRVYDHLQLSTGIKPRPTLRELEPLYHAVRHGCFAGCYDEARKLYARRILKSADEHYSWFCLGAFGADLQLLSAFFENTWDQPVNSLPEKVKGWLWGEAGYCLRSIGRYTEAHSPIRRGAEIRFADGDWVDATTCFRNLSELELVLGLVPEAIHSAEKAVAAAYQSRSTNQCAESLSALAHAYEQNGKFTKAAEYFERASKAQAPWFRLCFGLSAFQFQNFLLRDAERYAARISLGLPLCLADFNADRVLYELSSASSAIVSLAKESLRLALQAEYPVFLGLAWMTAARIALYHAILLNEKPSALESYQMAAKRLEAGEAALNCGAMLEFRPSLLLTRSWLMYSTGNKAAAESDLNEAWEIAERGLMRLHMADIHLYRARLFFRDTPYPWKFPQDDLVAARQLITQSGCWRRKKELEDAEAAAKEWLDS